MIHVQPAKGGKTQATVLSVQIDGTFCFWTRYLAILRLHEFRISVRGGV